MSKKKLKPFDIDFLKELLSYEEALKKNPLPGRLPVMLREAVEDARRAEMTPNVKIDMTIYYLRRDEGCFVCMAGSLLLARGAEPSSQRFSIFSSLPQRDQSVLGVIDALRRGDADRVLEGFLLFAKPPPTEEQRIVIRSVCNYICAERAGAPRAEWSVYLNAAARMESAGL